MQITFPTPIPDPSGHLIQIIHDKLEIDANMELTQTVRLRFFTNDEGKFGIPLQEAFRINPNLTEDQKQRLIRQWRDQSRTATTRGNYVDRDGQLVEVDEFGNYPDGSFPEKMMWVSVLAEQVPGNTVSDKVIALIVQSMGKMVQNGRI